MTADWAASSARAHLLSPRREATLICDLAKARAAAAAHHPAACHCIPCRIRHYDTNRRHVTELCNHTQGDQ